MDSIPQKRCSRCKQEFPRTLEYFCSAKSRSDGLNCYCKPCSNIRAADWIALHPKQHEAKKATERARQAKKRESPDFNDKRRPKRNLKLENERRAIRRATEPAYRERENTKMRERRAAKGDYWRLKNRMYSAKRRTQMGTEHYTIKDVDTQYRSQKGLCWWCEKELNGIYHIDHRIPLSRGGSDKATNIVISCPLCNERKHDKLPHEWNGRLL